MKFKFLSLMFVVSFSAFGNQLCEEESSMNDGGGGSAAKIVKFLEGSGCPDKAKIKNICAAVSSQMKDPKDQSFYMYQRYLYAAACVTDQDSKEVKAQKIREAWTKLEDDLVCTSVQFDVLKGNILKFAIAKKFNAFLNEAIELQVNLNRVDSTDNRTVLDYIKFHWDLNKQNALGVVYERYYDVLKNAGAKHAKDL